MKTVFYHQESGPKQFAVLSENKDGTVNIGPAEGEPVVTSARILDEPRIGCCTAAESPKPESPSSDDLNAKKVDELRVIAKELGVESTGLKKDELIAAIQAAQNPK